MKYFILLLLAVLIFACEPEEKPRVIQKYSIEQFYENVNIFGGSFSSDESKLLVSSNETGIYNVNELLLDGSAPKPLTESTEESYFAQAYFPNDDRVLYTYDAGGNENYGLYVMTPGGAEKNLTPWDSTTNSFYGWSRDLESIFFSSNKRDARFMDIYELPISSMEDEFPLSEMIYQNDQGWNVASISPNKRYLALVQSITSANSKMYLKDRESDETRDISEHEGDVQYDPQFFSLDNSELYFTTDEGSEFAYLAKMNVESGEVEKVFETNWDVRYAYHSFNEKYRVIGINEDGKTRIRVFELPSGNEIEIPEVEGGSISSVSISRSENLARLTVSTSSSPSNIYLLDFKSGELKKLTNTLNPEINPEDLVDGKVIRYKSFDGTEIPAIYYQPLEASEKNMVPGLVWVHGGPGGQSRLSYFALIQYLVNQGYAVLAVNNRGSGGYGKTFFHMDDKNHGDKDLKDCVAGKDFLASTNVIDPDRIGIIGGSYGGYMVMAALCYEPEAFDVGVNIFGVTNWLRTLKSIPPYWESFRKALYDEMGDPGTADSVRLYNISPVFFGGNVTKPLMVLQGANDVRVLQVESDEMVAAVKENGVPVEYVIFDDEGHGFRKKENEIEGYGKVKIFLDQYLKGEEIE
jgi:dipeptidyl aminopeptidase/acylaminoacyl peptidase